jgi:hypothetical protein
MISTLKPRILNALHSFAIVGHLGFQNTYARSRHYFFWEGMKKDILTLFIECYIFQRNKGEIFRSPRAPQSLPILASIWTHISMEFIVGCNTPKTSPSYIYVL